MSCGRCISRQHLHKKNLIFLVLVTEPAMRIAAKTSTTIFSWHGYILIRKTRFFADYVNETLMLSQGSALVMETDSRSESSGFIEEATEESSTEGSSSDYDTDSDIDLENSGYNITINPVNQAEPTDDDADENDSVGPTNWFNVFYLMLQLVLWRILVEETNRYVKIHNTSNWKDVTTIEMKGFLSGMFNTGLIKKKLNDYWKTKYESQSTP